MSTTRPSNEASVHLERLQNAIVEYLDGLEKHNAQIFEYRGISIRSVIEKKLYFKHLNSQQINFTEKSSSYAQMFGEKMTTSRGLSIRGLSRKLNSFLQKPQIPALPEVETLCLISSEKHEKYLDNILQNKGHLVYKITFQQLIGPHLNLSRYSNQFHPDRAKASDYLIQNHFDLLVEYELFTGILTNSSAKSIIFIEGNSPQDNLASLCAKRLKIKSICIQHGWACNVHLAFKNLCFDSFIGWGTQFTKLLKPYSLNTEFLNFGHPLLKKSFKQEGRIDRSISIIMQGIVGAIDEATFNAFNASLSKLIDQGWALLIREHPSHPLDNKLKQDLESKGAKIMDKSISLQEQLRQSQYTYTIHSSVGFEALLSGNLVIFGWFDLNLDFYPEINKNGLAYIIHDESSLMELLDNLEANQGIRRAEALERVTENIDQYFSASSSESRNQILKHLFKQ